MPKNKSERNKEIIALHESGKNYQEIATQYNISRQRVYNIVYNYLYTKNKDKKIQQAEKVIYPNIRRWLIENQKTICELSDLVNPDVNSPVALTRLLTDKTVKTNIGTIQRILEITGMTFEEAFSTKDKEV